MRSKLWKTKVSLHVLSACSGFSLIFLWTGFFFYNQSPSYIDKWRLFENLWGKNIKKEKRLLTCLKNCFTVQQPPLPPPSSFRASELLAVLLPVQLPAPVLGPSPCAKSSGCRSHASGSAPGLSALGGWILHRGLAWAALLELPSASLLPELKTRGQIDGDVRSTFSQRSTKSW